VAGPSMRTWPVVQPDRARAQVLHLLGAVGDKEQGLARLFHLRDPREALLLEAASPTASASSISRMSGWMWIATEKPRRTCMPEE
jgi:hypothetical protein